MSEAFAVLSAGGTVVTANKRLARSITLDWNQRQRGEGLRAWPSPRVLPWAAFIASLHAASARRGGRAGTRLLLGEVHARLLWQDVIGAACAGLLPGAATPLAEEAARAWRLLREWRIPVATLATAADSRDSLAFAGWAEAYQLRCEAEGWADLAMLVPLLLADLGQGALEAPALLHLAGFTERTPLQEELLAGLAARGCRLSVDEPPAPAADTSHRRCSDAGEELEEAARWARRWREDEPHARIGIVVTDLASRPAQVRRRILDVISPRWRLEPARQLPVNFSLGQPLAGFGLVRVALRILGCLAGRLDHRQAAELLTSRYLPGSAVEAGARARLAWQAGQRAGSAIPLEKLLADAAPGAPLLHARLEALLAAIGRVPRRQRPGQWADAFRLLLEAAGWPGDAPLASDEYQVANAWQELLDELRSCDAVAGTLERPAALQLAGQMAGGRLFQPEGDPAAIQVLGTMEAVGQRFDALWVCGMTAQSWPPPARSTALLPLGLQRAHGLPGATPARVREQAEGLMRWLGAGARQLVFSSPSFEGDEPLAASPLLASLPAADDLPRWPGKTWIGRMQGGTPLERLADDPPLPVSDAEHPRGGASLLEHEAACPARAFLQHRLGAKEMPVPGNGIDARARGRITHRALELFYTAVGDHAQLLALGEAGRQQCLDAAIGQAIADWLRDETDAVLHKLARNEHERQRRLLARFIAGECARPGFRVLDTEKQEVLAAGLPALDRLQLQLRMDRIDELEDGSLLVIDYKTGRQLPGRNQWVGRLYSPQLPLYATHCAADGIAFAQITAAKMAWQGVAAGAGDIKGIVSAGKLGEPAIGSWPELQTWWREGLERLAREFLAGCFDVNRKKPQDALGEWAMAIRPQELGELEEMAEDEP